MPGVPNAYEACVFTFGIVQSGGAGKLLSEYIVHGEPETDAWAVDPRRFTDHVDQVYTKAKAIETYSHEYAMHFPQIQWDDGRPAKTGNLYQRHLDDGGVMGVYGGWERADYYAPDGFTPAQVDSYDRQPFFDIVGWNAAMWPNTWVFWTCPAFRVPACLGGRGRLVIWSDDQQAARHWPYRWAILPLQKAKFCLKCRSAVLLRMNSG